MELQLGSLKRDYPKKFGKIKDKFIWKMCLKENKIN